MGTEIEAACSGGVEVSNMLKKLRYVYLDKESISKMIFFLYLCTLLVHHGGAGFIILFLTELFWLLTGRQKLAVTVEIIWYGVFLLYYFLSGIWAPDRGDLFDYGIMVSFLQIMSCIVILSNHIHSVRDAEKYLKIYYLALLYMAFILVIKTPVSAWGTERVGGAIYVNANDIGMRCTTASLIALYYARNKRLHYIFFAFFMLIGLLSGSRKALIILAGGILIYYLGKEKGGKRIRNICIGLILIFGILYFIMTNPALYRVIGIRMEATVRNIMGSAVYGLKDRSGIERAFYRKNAMQMFFEKPILGWGGNSFVTRMRQIHYRHIAYSHCNYTELLATLGIAGFIIYYSRQFCMLFKSLKAFSDKKNMLILLIISLVTVELIIEFFYVSYYAMDTNILIGIESLLLKCLIRDKKTGYLSLLKRCLNNSGYRE